MKIFKCVVLAIWVLGSLVIIKKCQNEEARIKSLAGFTNTIPVTNGPSGPPIDWSERDVYDEQGNLIYYGRASRAKLLNQVGEPEMLLSWKTNGVVTIESRKVVVYSIYAPSVVNSNGLWVITFPE